jgi:hypothetical protein
MYDILGNFKPINCNRKIKIKLISETNNIFLHNEEFQETNKLLNLLKDIAEIRFLEPKKVVHNHTKNVWYHVTLPRYERNKKIHDRLLWDKLNYTKETYAKELLNYLEQDCNIILDSNLKGQFWALTNHNLWNLSKNQLKAAHKLKKYDKNGNRIRY